MCVAVAIPRKRPELRSLIEQRSSELCLELSLGISKYKEKTAQKVASGSLKKVPEYGKASVPKAYKIVTRQEATTDCSIFVSNKKNTTTVAELTIGFIKDATKRRA